MSKINKKVLINGTIFDSTGRPPFKGSLAIEGNKIAGIWEKEGGEIPEGAEVIDLKGLFVMPGMIDAHLHLTGSRSGKIEEELTTPIGVFYARAVRDLEALTSAGFTTVVDAGSIIGLHLREAVKEGTVGGPRVVAAGPVLSQTGGHGDTHYMPLEWVDYRTTKKQSAFASLICDGADQCRSAARYAVRENADFIKVMASGGVLSQRDRPEYRGFTLQELEAIVDEARAAGKWVHAHAEGKSGVINAARAGVKIIAHCDLMDEEAAREVAKAGAIIVPTFAIHYKLIEQGEKLGVPAWGMKKITEINELHEENIRRAYKIGIRIATGTDFSGGVGKHGENAVELKYLVEKAGMSPFEALRAATSVAAEAAGLGGITGTLEKGRLADVIAVRGNPLEDLGVLLEPDNVKLVVRDGDTLKKTLN